jgi:hypothetical protein
MTDATATARTTATSDRAAIPMAIFLWVLVAVALAYGVIQTLSKVVKLFS